VARVNLLEHLVGRGAESAVSWILASLQIDFLAETFYGADVVATITAASAGNSSLTLDCEMVQGDRPTVRGRAVLVHRDSASKTSSRIPDDIRQRLAALRLAPCPPR